MAEVVTGLHAVTVHVRDLEKARAFYHEVLGLNELNFQEKAHRAVFAIPGSSTLLAIHVPAPGEDGREPGTVSGVVFRNPDPAAACEEIQRRGGTVTVEARVIDSPFGEFVRAVIADPDGNEFVLSNRTD
jgi:catechol 2,3-dioxygenase-like lactoylglutathione lyase family enzyme